MDFQQRIQHPGLCFNTEGVCLWQIMMGPAGNDTAMVKGLCFAGINKENFIVTLKIVLNYETFRTAR